MREILFRGKRLDGGQWVYGYLVKRPSPIQLPGYGGPWYISAPPEDPDDHGGCYNIDPATVGQYTGLSDKHGRKIFEGDILGFVNNDGDLSLHIVEWDAEGAKWIIRYPQKDHTEPDDMADWAPREWEILGTQWDNPGLMKEATGDG